MRHLLRFFKFLALRRYTPYSPGRNFGESPPPGLQMRRKHQLTHVYPCLPRFWKLGNLQTPWLLGSTVNASRVYGCSPGRQMSFTDADWICKSRVKRQKKPSSGRLRLVGSRTWIPCSASASEANQRISRECLLDVHQSCTTFMSTAMTSSSS